MTSTANDPAIPDKLLAEINDGNCVAFLGAGFSVPAGLPGWVDLLRQIADGEGVKEDVRDHTKNLVMSGSAHDLDQAAQVLEDSIGRKEFAERLRDALSNVEFSREMNERLRMLRGIPFRAILTTNFDPILKGRPPDEAAFRRVLRPRSHRWWDPRFWDDSARGARVVKLHGDVDAAGGAVITRRDYRRLLYQNPAYETFLRAVMSTSTVLYLGFSFGDAYLNELRSEVLALLGTERGAAPIAYALINDVPKLSVDHFLRHEGMQVLSYDTKSGAGPATGLPTDSESSIPHPPGADYGGFLRTLRKIHDATNPVYRIAQLLDGKRILWVDSHPENNNYGHWVLGRIARGHQRGGPQIENALTCADGVAALDRAKATGQPFDLVISHWGHAESKADDGSKCSTAERLLLDMRRHDYFSPVLIFSRRFDEDHRKKTILGLGAQAYCFSYDALLRKMEEVLVGGAKTG